jgi:putative membrane protein
MIDLPWQPTLSAVLNASAATLLVLGYRAVKRGSLSTHKKLMISAFACSSMFLTNYVAQRILHGELKFDETGILRTVYLVLLIPHVLLAIAMLPMILMTFYYAFRGMSVSHKKLARVTLPVWLYVSVTGVILFFWQQVVFPDKMVPMKAKVEAAAPK